MAKILLVEDDPDQGREFKLYLESSDGGSHQVDWARSATAAVRVAEEDKHDLVLLDIMMAYQPEDETNAEIQDHEVDYGRKMGLYVYNKIRALPTPPPIGILSVVGELSVLADFPEAVGRLRKHFYLNELGAAVKNWLGSR